MAEYVDKPLNLGQRYIAAMEGTLNEGEMRELISDMEAALGIQELQIYSLRKDIEELKNG